MGKAEVAEEARVRGNELLKKGQYQEAFVAYSQGLAAEPNNKALLRWGRAGVEACESAANTTGEPPPSISLPAQQPVAGCAALRQIQGCPARCRWRHRRGPRLAQRCAAFHYWFLSLTIVVVAASGSGLS